MATISYRPELENPSREAALAFSFMDENKKAMRILTLNPGINRNVDDKTWSVIEGTPAMQALIKIKAVEVLGGSGDTVGVVNASSSPDLDEAMGMPVVDAFKIIEGTFDDDFLRAWKGKEGRSTVLNKINQRLKQLDAGQG